MSQPLQTRSLGKCLITGGAGFLGRNIAKALGREGVQVVIADRVKPQKLSDNEEFIELDVTDRDKVLAAFADKNIDTVFHTAAIIELGGGSAATQAYRQRSLAVNVQGTQNVIDACQAAGIGNLVYTSSNVVCYDGLPVTGLNSDTPYASRVYDMYTESKIAAEKRVLAANGQSGLLSVAIRPSGIYGAESNMMLDKFVAELAAGKLVAAIGNPNAVHENSFIDNLVHGHLQAAKHLVDGNRCCGRGYFISDNEPQNYFDFFRPLIDGLGYKYPTFWIPMGMLVPIMQLWQWSHFKFGLPAPAMLPKEIDKVCVTHISDTWESKRDLNYEPLMSVSEAMEVCLPYCRRLHDQLVSQSSKKSGNTEAAA
ncbi:3 beta-hydroxysteroid dehydrogenase/Delta 5--_4-isomerase [BD1-7 clade bacterium]|uniref:3 beta-hydroxysteroid dehydrogenase/Delta 5-->4-isomerase n=1 Tax=BD1-7 clade bacterium TaxID=2029982 RepID=A0A5S9QT23_9GAMM|nr:3 beta-hydroxysteroid dehydrogenase/Delta 5-->4-isomerase [BD1-7 clade bacterium]